MMRCNLGRRKCKRLDRADSSYERYIVQHSSFNLLLGSTNYMTVILCLSDFCVLLTPGSKMQVFTEPRDIRSCLVSD